MEVKTKKCVSVFQSVLSSYNINYKVAKMEVHVKRIVLNPSFHLSMTILSILYNGKGIQDLSPYQRRLMCSSIQKHTLNQVFMKKIEYINMLCVESNLNNFFQKLNSLFLQSGILKYSKFILRALFSVHNLHKHFRNSAPIPSLRTC